LFAGDLLLTADSQVTTRKDGSLTGENFGNSTNATVTRARMFDTPYDVAVSAVLAFPEPLAGQGQLHWWLEGSPGLLASGTTQILISIPALLLSAAGDFTGDGYDDLIFFTRDPGGNRIAIAATAVDPTDASQGLKFGPVAGFNINFVIDPLAITVATPIATPEVLIVGGFSDGSDRSAGFCGLAIKAFTVDPTTLAITDQGGLPLSLSEGNAAVVGSASIAAGRFGTTLYDQLAVAYFVPERQGHHRRCRCPGRLGPEGDLRQRDRRSHR
jgi:hypothetical protein